MATPREIEIPRGKTVIKVTTTVDDVVRLLEPRVDYRLVGNLIVPMRHIKTPIEATMIDAPRPPFTPGPWTHMPHDQWDICRKSEDGYARIATLWRFNQDEGDANAALIMAAPEMFSVLEAFVRQWRIYRTLEPLAPGNNPDYPAISISRETWERADAVLTGVLFSVEHDPDKVPSEGEDT